MTDAKLLWLLGQIMEGDALIGLCVVIFIFACWLIMKIEGKSK